MRALVTGAAGFIASHLVERLLSDGHWVRGVDCFTSFYPVERKHDNLKRSRNNPRFDFVSADLAHCELAPLVADVDVIFHLAGQPGVRSSWHDLAAYVDYNINVTNRLLTAVRDGGLRRFVFASSSSVYGDQQPYPTPECASTRPSSPYGVTKLAAEQLCRLHAEHHQVPIVILRYFSVYGPRQRPDMALYRILDAALNRTAFPAFGDGRQIRDFTYVGDVVAATVAAAERAVAPGTVLNIAGGSAISVADLVAVVEEELSCPVPVEYLRTQPGDMARTCGATERAHRLLDWRPEVGVRQGVRAQADWQMGQR